MKSSWINWIGPKFNDQCHKKRRKEIHREKGQAQRLELWDAWSYQKLVEARKGPLKMPSGNFKPADTWIWSARF